MTNSKNKNDIQKRLDIIMAELHNIENRRVEIMKEAQKILDSNRLNNLRKKILNK